MIASGYLHNSGSDQNLSVIKFPISTSSMVEEKISLKVSVK
jgi:hypothetical protein